MSIPIPTLDEVERWASQNQGTRARIKSGWGTHTGYLSTGGVSGLSVRDSNRGGSRQYKSINETMLTPDGGRHGQRLEVRLPGEPRYVPIAEAMHVWPIREDA